MNISILRSRNNQDISVQLFGINDYNQVYFIPKSMIIICNIYNYIYPILLFFKLETYNFYKHFPTVFIWNRKHLLLEKFEGGADYGIYFRSGDTSNPPNWPPISWGPLAVTLLSLQCSPSMPPPPARLSTKSGQSASR